METILCVFAGYAPVRSAEICRLVVDFDRSTDAAAAMRPVPPHGLFGAFAANLWRAFNGTHQFIYAVSFITPIFYLLYERYLTASDHVLSGRRKITDVRLAPPGFGCVLVWSIFVFLFTAFAYALSTTAADRSSPTFMDQFAARSAWIVYLFALLCWYLAILDSIGPPSPDFGATVKKQGEDLTERLRAKKGNARENPDE